MFKLKFPESEFVSRIDALSAASSKLMSFQEIGWSTNLWQEHGGFDDAPFIVRNYPDVWKDGKCPTEGQFIKCAADIHSHPDGTVFITFLEICTE